MSFPNAAPTPEPAAAAAPDAGAAPAQPAAPAPSAPAEQQQAAAVHPAWDQALGNIPEGWQGPIREQIRVQEAEFQKELEKARSGGVPEDWRGLYDQAHQLGLSPQELVEAYNGQQQLYQQMVADPDGFLDSLRSEIDQAVQQGLITRKQAAQIDAQAQAQVDAAAGADLLTPEQQQIQALQARLDQRDQQELTERQQYAQQQQFEQMQQAAADEAQNFVAAVHDAFDTDPQLAGAKPEVRQIAAQVASGYLDADTTGQLTYATAIQQALAQLRQQLGWGGAPAPLQGQQQAASPAAAIGGGVNGAPAAAPQQWDLKTREGKDARDAALVAAIKNGQIPGLD